MTIDASAVARVTGIETAFEDMRAGAILYLPQRVAVIAQGNSDAVYSSTKFQASRASDVGAVAGYGSPAHLAVMQLLPTNGDGVGTIPVDVYLLQQLAGAVAATGDVTPSGTQTVAGSYRLKIGGVYSQPFVIPVGASVSYIIGAMLAAAQAVLEMPANLTPAYGTLTSTAASGNGGNGTLTALAVAGSSTPRPGAWTLKNVAAVANGGTFRLYDPDGNAVGSPVSMTPGATGVTPLSAGGINFSLTDGSTDFAVGDSFVINVPATKLNVVMKWKGDSSNAARIFVEGTLHGVIFAYTQPSGGAGNPSVSPALAQFGSVWETMVLNCLNIEDTANLDAIAAYNEGRWLDTIGKPFVSFVGNTYADVADATAVTTLRRTDRTNVQLTSPGAFDLPFVVAARELAKLVVIANQNPARDYGSQKATGLKPGADNLQWDWPTRDRAVKNGSSTIEVVDSIVCLSDTVTMYRPTGEDPPGYRYVCDIVKLQNIIFNLRLRFQNENWDGNPLIPDGQPSVNADARHPSDAVAEANAMLDSLGDYAIISDPKTAKTKTNAAIDAQNPKRWNLNVEVQLSGNSNVKSVRLGFGFFFGGQAQAA